MTFWDSSALVALLVEEPESEVRAGQFRADPLIAIWWGSLVECESAIQRRVREGALSRAEARTAQERLAQLADVWHEVAPTSAVRKLAVRLLRTHPLRAADALQLAAALSIAEAGVDRFAFVSADQRLNAAAESEGVRLISG